MKLFSFLGSLFSLLQTAVCYNKTQLETGIWLSGAAYCDKSEYPTMNLAGPAAGFIYKETLYDVKTDLNGYIGVLPSTRTIYVVIRGTNSFLNWVDDFEVQLTPYSDCDCNVHTGFYNSVLQIVNKTRFTIRMLKARYPFYSIIATGHSYGAATSALLALEIQKDKFQVDVYNYGQPRIGDAAFAQYTNSQIKNYWRMVHDKDVVPHLPPTDPFLYQHSATEIFEDESHQLHTCSSTNGEDPECAGQFSLKQTNADDHSYYLEHFFDCGASTQTS
jgi:hypothetical protein